MQIFMILNILRFVISSTSLTKALSTTTSAICGPREHLIPASEGGPLCICKDGYTGTKWLHSFKRWFGNCTVVHVVLTEGKCDFNDLVEAYPCKILPENLMPSYDFYDFGVKPLDLPAGCVAFTTAYGHKYITYNGNSFARGPCTTDYKCICRRDRNTQPPTTKSPITAITSTRKVSLKTSALPTTTARCGPREDYLPAFEGGPLCVCKGGYTGAEWVHNVKSWVGNCTIKYLTVTEGTCDVGDTVEANPCKLLTKSLMPSYDYHTFAVTPVGLPTGCVAFTTSNGHKYITYNGNFFTHGRCSADYICLCRRDRNTRPPKTIVITSSPKKVSFLVPVTAGAASLTIVIVVVAVVVVVCRQRTKRAFQGLDAQEPLFAPVANAFQIPFEQLQLGTTFAKGSQGRVMAGTFAGKRVAIKELVALVQDPSDTDALHDEASMLCSIHHPNIVRFYGMSTHNSSYYFVTDLKDTDLRRLIEEADQGPKADLIRMAADICRPLEFLHSLNMVHRDLKPANILLDSSRNVYLCDFGISKTFSADSSKVDMTQNLGTAAYMAPELSNVAEVAKLSGNFSDFEITKDKSIPLDEMDGRLAQNHDNSLAKANLQFATDEDGRRVPIGRRRSIELSATKVDCYSFALVLWALLSWKLPFRELTAMQILLATSFYHKRPSTKHLENVWPPVVLDLMRNMWAPDPALRPSMEEARTVLQPE